MTQQQAQPPTPAPFEPRTSQILAEPATVAACRADYEQAEARRAMDQQDGQETR
jgi:hypothetical protein